MSDKTQNQTFCPRCGLTFSGRRSGCPLCGQKLGEAETEDFDIFPVIPLKQNRSVFMKVVTFMAIAAVIAAGMTDRLMASMGKEAPAVLLPVAIGVTGGYILLAVGQRKWKNLRKMVMYEVIIGLLLCMAYDRYTGWKGWSLQVVFPMTVAGMNLLYFVLGFADRQHQTDYGIYFFITIIGTAAVIVLTMAGVIEGTGIVIVTAGLGILLLFAKLIFQGKSFLSELSRRLHV